MSTNAKEAELRERILNQRLPTSVPRVLFFPDYALKHVLNHNVVAEVIAESEIPFHDQSSVIKYVLGGAQKIFCILVCIRQVNYTHFFLWSGIWDAKLALSKEDLLSSHLPAFAVDEFWGQQWEFIAPIFKSGVQKLNSSCILPFKEERVLGEGGYGSVTRVVLYRSHQDLVSDSPEDTVVVARKSIKRSTRTETYFESERAPLELLKTRGHPHIIELLGSYSQADGYNFFFPLAQGSLRDLFDRGKQSFGIDTEGFYSSIVGLSSAINHIHNFTYEMDGKNKDFKGYHHDLKPGNILVRQGKFIIADFGLSKFKADANTSSTLHKVGTTAYLPPEAANPNPETNFDDPIVGRGVDIWAFACILAEIATYLVRGSSGVSEFGRRRTTKVSASMRDDSFHAHGEVKDEVKEWLGSLKATAERGSDLQIVRLIQIVQKALIPDRKKRPTARVVLEEASMLDPEAAINVELFVSQERKTLPPSPPISPAGSPQFRPQTTSPGSGAPRDYHGIDVLSEGTLDPDLQMDVVAVHGLNGGPHTCWQGGSGSIWLKDFLPSNEMHLHCIITYGYDSEYLFTHLSEATLKKEAGNLLRRIQRRREAEKASTRPIVFLAHSVGGFLLKQAILLAEEGDQYQDLFKSIYGVTFFGTPHRQHGFQYTMGACLRKIAKTAPVSEQSRELLRESMSDNEGLLREVNYSFKTKVCIPGGNLRVVSFYETKATPGLGVIVDEYAGTMGLNSGEEVCGLELSHSDLCRYSSETEPSYKAVLRRVLRLTRIATAEYNSKQARQRKQEVPYINHNQQFSPEIHVNNIIRQLQQWPTTQSTQHSNMTPPHQPTTIPVLAPTPRAQTKPPPPPPPPHTLPKKKQPSPPQPPPQKKSQTQSRTSINAIEERLAKVNRNISSIAADLTARQKERKALKLRRQERGEEWFSNETKSLEKRITALEARRTEARKEQERLKLELAGARTAHQTT